MPRGGGDGGSAELGACTKGGQLPGSARGSDDGAGARGGAGRIHAVGAGKDTEEAQVSMAEMPAAGVAVDVVLDAQVARSDAVLVGLLRLAFLTSDVAVLVTTHSLLSAYARILSWAQVASGGVMLAARAPALVLVCNWLGNVVPQRRRAARGGEAGRGGEIKAFPAAARAWRQRVPAVVAARPSRQHNPQQPRLGAFSARCRSFTSPSFPALPAAPPPHPLVAELASRQLGRFQARHRRRRAGGCDGGGRRRQGPDRAWWCGCGGAPCR